MGDALVAFILGSDNRIYAKRFPAAAPGNYITAMADGSCRQHRIRHVLDECEVGAMFSMGVSG